MAHSPSRRSPGPEYARAMIKRPYPGVLLPDHYSPYAYAPVPHQRPPYLQSGPHSSAYNSVGHDSYYRPPQGEDPYYYPYHPYARTFHKSGYRFPHPPMPHPPAPPAPPRRDVRPHRGRGSPRSSPAPSANYYRAQVGYDSQHVPPRPHPQLDRARTSQDDEDDVSLSQLRLERERRSRSESTGSRGDSEVPESTPSPVDPERTQWWEEQHSNGRTSRSSSESSSYREDVGAEKEAEYDVIDPALMDTSSSRYTPSSHGYEEPAVDDVSLDGSAAGDVDLEPEDAGVDMFNSQKRPNSKYYPSPHHQVQFAALAKRENGEQLQIGLNSLVDSQSGERPAYPIPTIIKCAILGSPHKQLTLSELYLAMEERFPYYRTSDKKSWRNSVRHNLSLNNQFDKKPRPMTEPGKGHYWVVNAETPQGNKRERKRNKKLGKRALAALAAHEARLAREKQAELSADANSNTNTDTNEANKGEANKNGDKEASNESRLTGVPSVYPPRGRVTVTLPANAGSYAAVTGAISMPAINRRLFRPWRGDTSSSSINNDASQAASSVSASSDSTTMASQRDKDALQKITNSGESKQPHHKQPTSERPSLGESLPRLTVVKSPQPWRQASQGSGSGEKSSCGVQRSSKSRGSRLYSPIAVDPPGPATLRRSAFETLAAQIEREGIGASGSGGPGSRIRKRLDRCDRRRAIDDDDSATNNESDPSSDGEYLPNRIRGR